MLCCPFLADLADLCSPAGKADILALLRVVFPCVFVTFPYGVPGQVLDFIDSSTLTSSLLCNLNFLFA